MIKILVEKEKYWDSDLDDRYFDVNAEFKLDEESNTYSAVKMFADAMILEGYFNSSIIKAFKNYIEEYSEEDNYKEDV